MIFQIIGKITPPVPFQPGEPGQYGDFTSGLTGFLNNLVRLLIVAGGIWAFINLILAGYGFLGAGDDPKKIEAAWKKIWMSALGLGFILASFLLAAILGHLLFGSTTAILQPKIYGP